MVDGIERELRDEARVVRLDRASRTGQQLPAHMAVRGLPTLIVTDGEGQVVLRQVGGIHKDPVATAVHQASEIASKG